MSESKAITNAVKEKLLQGALDARNASYSPYSNFRVGAAILTASGDIVKGCNIENAAYSPGICAERSAFCSAISNGQRTIRAVAVASDLDGPCSPCGVCRQFMREFLPLDTPIYMVPSSYSSSKGAEGAQPVLESTMGDLLPHSFGPEDLQKPRSSD